MNLSPTSDKTSEEQKKKLEFIIHSNDIGDVLTKNEFDTENYKEKPKETKEINVSPSPTFSSIRKENLKPLESIINEQNTNNNFTLNVVKNDSFTNLQRYLQNFSDKNTENIDFEYIFKPSNSVLKKINEKFNLNNNINYQNILKSEPSHIPALKNGGIVKEPTVAYLHENEAVVPLDRINKFSEFIKSTNKNSVKNTSNNISNYSNVKNNNSNLSETLGVSNTSTSNISKNDMNSMINQLSSNTASTSSISKNESVNVKNTSRNVSTVSKNENISNVNDIRKTMTERNNSQKIYNERNLTKIENRQNVQSNNQPMIVNSQQPQDPQVGEVKLGSVYGGSSSRANFMTGTFKIPGWRTMLG